MKSKIFKLVEKFKIFLPIALAIIITGVILMCTVGMNVGLDFSGGAQLTINFGEFENNEQQNQVYDLVEDTITSNKFEIGSVRWANDAVSGASLEIGLEYKYDGKVIDASNEQLQQEFLDSINGVDEHDTNSLKYKIMTAVNAQYSNFELASDSFSSRIVNATTAKNLLTNAIWATAVAIVAILIYIALRFTLTSGIAAILALMHDVLVMFSLVTIFQIQINTTFIAAIITVVGYSINATIVIFDRIREIKKMPSMEKATETEIANMAVSNTLSRSILTTITTLATILALSVVCAIMGVSTMLEFALPIIFGLLAGFYSSVFLSASIWVYLKKLAKLFKTKRKKA
ncbi:MAG: protein translocase subunit SecF [Clostridia bacterium]|nr:protein translocase subunit SecF [Clostridia bacterium]